MTKPSEPVAVPNYPVDCTASRAAPVLDTICSGYFIANGIYLAAVASCESASFGQSCVKSDTKTTGIVLSAGLAVLCGISAAAGYGTASRCQEVKDLNAGCMSGDVKACQQLRPGWTPTAAPPAAAPGPATPPPQAPQPSPPPPAGCTKDTDCKGVRICVAGNCVEPTK